jgi:hypothetical protein
MLTSQKTPTIKKRKILSTCPPSSLIVFNLSSGATVGTKMVIMRCLIAMSIISTSQSLSIGCTFVFIVMIATDICRGIRRTCNRLTLYHFKRRQRLRRDRVRADYKSNHQQHQQAKQNKTKQNQNAENMQTSLDTQSYSRILRLFPQQNLDVRLCPFGAKILCQRGRFVVVFVSCSVREYDVHKPSND